MLAGKRFIRFVGRNTNLYFYNIVHISFNFWISASVVFYISRSKRRVMSLIQKAYSVLENIRLFSLFICFAEAYILIRNPNIVSHSDPYVWIGFVAVSAVIIYASLGAGDFELDWDVISGWLIASIFLIFGIVSVLELPSEFLRIILGVIFTIAGIITGFREYLPEVGDISKTD